MDAPGGHDNFVENNIFQIFVIANLGLNFSFVLVNFGSQLFCKPFCLVLFKYCNAKVIKTFNMKDKLIEPNQSKLN